MADKSLGFNIFMDADTKTAERKVGAFAESMQRRIERAVRSLPDIELGADASEVDRRIQEIRRELQTLGSQRIGIDIDAGVAQAKLERLRGELVQLGGQSADIQVRADTARAAAALGAVSAQARRLDGDQVNITVSARDAVHTVSMLGLIAAGLAGVSALAIPAAAALAALPAIGNAALSGVVTLGAGFSGVGDAVKALRTEETKAAAGTAQSAASRVNSAQAIIGAQRAVEDAVTRAHRAEITGAWQVEDAVRAVNDAERDWADAQADYQRAQEDLTRARAEAKEEIEDLDRSVRGAALSEKEAAIRLSEAQDRLNEARAKGTTGRDLEKLEVDAEQAALALENATDRREDLTEESERATRLGVAGSERVVSAQQRVTDAGQRVEAAERRIDQAREQADRARQQAAWAQQDAAKAIADAQRNLGNAYTDTGAAGAAAGNKVAEAMEGLSPEAQSFARMLVSEVIPGLEKIRDRIQASLLPKMEVSLRNLALLGPDIEDGLGGTADVLGNIAIKGSEMMTSGPFRADARTIMATNNRLLEDWGETGLNVIDMIRNLTVTSGPMVERFAQFARGGSESAAVFLENKRATGELDEFFDKAGDTMAEFGDILGDIIVGGAQLAQTMGPLGMILLRQLADLVAWVGQLAEAHPTMMTLVSSLVIGAAAFNKIGTIIGGLMVTMPAMIGNWRNLAGLVGGLAPSAVASGAGMMAASRGMEAASIAAGTGTERMLGWAVGAKTAAGAGEMVMSSGNRVAGVLTRIGAHLPIVGVAAVALAAAYELLVTSADEAADVMLKGGGAAEQMTQKMQQQNAAVSGWLQYIPVAGSYLAELNDRYEVFAPNLEDATRAMEAQRAAMDPLSRATSDAARAQADYLYALEQGDMVKAEDAYRRFTTATEEQARQQRILDDNLKATTRSLEEQVGIVLGAVEADIRYQDALARATSAVAENGATHDRTTEAGRRNEQALIDLSREAARNEEAMRNNGASADMMRHFHDGARNELIRVAQQMGYNQGEAQRLADRYLAVPRDIPTTFWAHTGAARAAVEAFARDTSNIMASVRDEQVIVSFASDTGNILRARGGPVFGAGTETSDSIPARLSTNEHVWSAKEVRGAGGHGNVQRLRAMAAAGDLPVPGFAEGGAIHEQFAADFIAAGLANVKAANAKFIRDNFPRGGEALSWARSQAGKPYIWAAVGPRGYDCSGFMSAITNVMRKRPPHSRVGATASFPWAGFRPGGGGAFVIGSTANAGGGIGHMAGTLFGVNVESRGSDGVVVGPRARGANDRLFNTRASFVMDRGGMWPHGSFGWNLSGRPERVLTPRQTDSFERLVEVLTTKYGSNPLTVHGIVPGSRDGTQGPGSDLPTWLPALRSAFAMAMERVFASGIRTDVDFDGLSIRLNRVKQLNQRR